MTTNATASIAGDLGDANGGVTYTARAAGEAGNALRVRQILDENEGRMSVEIVVVGNDVSVALSRASTPWPTCTAAEVVAAVAADPAASALVEAAFSGDGSGTPGYVTSSATESPWTDAPFTDLAGGSDTVGGGGGSPLPGGVTASAEQALERLIQQFKGKPRIEALIRALASRTQQLNDVLVQLATQRGIDTAIGAQLDVLGAKVGQPRNGMDDATYRVWVRARIRLNLCSGTLDEISSVFALILPTIGGNGFELDPQYPAGLALRILDQLAADAGHFARILQQAKAAGVRALLEWRESAEVETFQCQAAEALPAVGMLDLGTAAGDAVFDVDSTAGFPASGYLVLDSGLPAEETLPFEVVGPQQLQTLIDSAQDHPAGAEVALAPGNGGGDATNAGTGGGLAGAREQ